MITSKEAPELHLLRLPHLNEILSTLPPWALSLICGGTEVLLEPLESSEETPGARGLEDEMGYREVHSSIKMAFTKGLCYHWS